jgi:hypothetical protein
MPKTKVPKRIHSTFTHAEQSYPGEPRHIALFADANNYNVRMIVWPNQIPALRAMLDEFEQQAQPAPKECAFCRVIVPSQPEQWQNADNDFFGTPVMINNIPACAECATTVENVGFDHLFRLEPVNLLINSEHPHIESAYVGLTSDGRAIAVMQNVFEAARDDEVSRLYEPDSWATHLDGENIHLIGHYAEISAQVSA